MFHFMFTRNQASDIFSRLTKFSAADEVECLFYGGRFALTRFANNTIHQNMAEENFGVSVRTVFNGRTARATTNKFDEESLRDVVRASESLAKVQETDPDLLPLADPGQAGCPEGAGLSRHFAQTAELTPGERADAVSRMVEIAEKQKLTAAGIFSSSE